MIFGHFCNNKEEIKKIGGLHITQVDHSLVPFFFNTPIKTPQLNKIVFHIHGTQDGTFHLPKLCWAGEREERGLTKVFHHLSQSNMEQEIAAQEPSEATEAG